MLSLRCPRCGSHLFSDIDSVWTCMACARQFEPSHSGWIRFERPHEEPVKEASINSILRGPRRRLDRSPSAW